MIFLLIISFFIILLILKVFDMIFEMNLKELNFQIIENLEIFLYNFN